MSSRRPDRDLATAALHPPDRSPDDWGVRPRYLPADGGGGSAVHMGMQQSLDGKPYCALSWNPSRGISLLPARKGGRGGAASPRRAVASVATDLWPVWTIFSRDPGGGRVAPPSRGERQATDDRPGTSSQFGLPRFSKPRAAFELDETGQCETGLLQMGVAEDSGLKGVCVPVRGLARRRHGVAFGRQGTRRVRASEKTNAIARIGISTPLRSTDPDPEGERSGQRSFGTVDTAGVAGRQHPAPGWVSPEARQPSRTYGGRLARVMNS